MGKDVFILTLTSVEVFFFSDRRVLATGPDQMLNSTTLFPLELYFVTSYEMVICEV